MRPPLCPGQSSLTHRALGGLVLLSLGLAAAAGGLPGPAKGGANGGPIELLLLRGHSEWQFGTQPELDATYQKMLRDRGYRVVECHEWQELSLDALRPFAVVVYLNPSPFMGGGYYDHTGWRSGRHLLTVRRNVEVLRRHVERGGGLLIVPALEEVGTRTTASLNHLFEPYGLATECAVVRDAARAYQVAKVGYEPVLYCWTERLAKHPIAEGVRRIYYPSYCTRWDDNYTTIPLKPLDAAWTVVAQGMAGSQTLWRRGSIYDNAGGWTSAEGWEEPAIAVARAYGKGRIAVVGISSWHLFYKTYAKKGDVTESSFSRIDGIAMEHGDGKTPSDLGRLLDNTYRWLAQASLAAGLGGYDPKKGTRLPDVDHSFDDTWLSDVWADGDPMITGPIRPIRILVGARSAVSDGKGSPAEWAQAAREAGIGVVCFTETFEHLKHDRWKPFVAECQKHSTDDVALLPGFDIDTDLGNRFLIVGHSARMRYHILTPDRKRLFWTGHMLLGMGDVLPVAARPQWLATVREKGALPPDVYSHCPGIAVGTWRGGKQTDDGLFAYKWHLDNASVPIPVAVHEVFAPGELAAAARTGLLNVVNADTAPHAAFYYRQAMAAFGGNPQRTYLSSGPIVDSCRIDDWRSPHWTVRLKAHGPHPITDVVVRDQRRVYRHLRPNAKAIDVRWSGDLAVQHWFLIELRDAAKGRAILSPVRTLPAHSFVRCQDRQNWFGMRHPWLAYTGRMTAGMATVQVPGVKLAAEVCPKAQMTYAGKDYSVVDYVLDSTFVPGGRPRGADNSPIFNVLPIPEYWGRVRYLCYRSGSRSVDPPDLVECMVDVRLEQDLKPVGSVWPIIGRTAGGAAYVFRDTKGARVEGKVAGFVDLPAGGCAGDIVALTPLRVGADGALGFAPPAEGQGAKAGTEYHGAFMKIDPAHRDAVLASMGLGDATPYKLALQQGTVRRILAAIELEAAGGGAAGTLQGGPMPVWPPAGVHTFRRVTPVPLKLHGANPRWPLGLWTADGNITQYGFLDGVGMGRLDVTKDTRFYFGSLLVASDPNLNLAFASEWTQQGATIEVNNPTEKAIVATVRSAAAIQDRKAIERKLTVAPGATLYVDVQ